jgi:3-deoxy-D-arabino-heptulosonate 7-phosphate (DAHP) synthase class II
MGERVGSKSDPRIWRGVIRERRRIVWTCDHEHGKPSAAVACATVERERRAERRSLGLPVAP